MACLQALTHIFSDLVSFVSKTWFCRFNEVARFTLTCRKSARHIHRLEYAFRTEFLREEWFGHILLYRLYPALFFVVFLSFFFLIIFSWWFNTVSPYVDVSQELSQSLQGLLGNKPPQLSIFSTLHYYLRWEEEALIHLPSAWCDRSGCDTHSSI